MMQTRTFTARFVTPAFLGNAEQVGQWRTPPFKALLRQWWRIAAAKDFDYDHRKLREAEGKLFGHAWLEDDQDRSGRIIHARQSLVRIRVESWNPGQLSSSGWPGGPMEQVITTLDGKGKVRSDVYLGYGPVLPPSRKQGRQSIEIRNAIGPDEEAILKIAFPDDPAASQRVMETFALMHWFGTLGSRGRNAWGSLHLGGSDVSWSNIPSVEDHILQRISQPWTKCLRDCDWPHAIASENGRPLVWRTEPMRDWRKAMGRLANIRVAVRRIAKTFVGPSGIGGIHILGYPAGGKWELRGVNQDLRLATQLRFKTLPSNDGKKVVGLVAHFPYRVPDAVAEALGDRRARWLDDHQEEIWKAVYRVLNHPDSKLNAL